MGVSESVITNVTTNVFNAYYDVVNTLVANAISDSKLKSSSAQFVQTTTCGPECYSQYAPKIPGDCIITDINIVQSSDIRNQYTGGSMSDVIANVKVNLATQTENYINNITNTHADWGTVALNVITNANTTVSNISANIANSVSSNTESFCHLEANQDQQARLLLCGIVNGVSINQSVYQTNVMSCITKQIVRFIASDGIITKAINAANNATTIGNQYLIYAIVGIVLVIIVFIIIGALSGKTPPDKLPTGNPSNPTPGNSSNPPDSSIPVT